MGWGAGNSKISVRYWISVGAQSNLPNRAPTEPKMTAVFAFSEVAGPVPGASSLSLGAVDVRVSIRLRLVPGAT